MGLTLEIRHLFHNSPDFTITKAKAYAARFKNGVQLQNYYRWLELFYIEERIKAGDPTEKILVYIRANRSEFLRPWSTSRINKVRMKLGKGISLADQVPGFTPLPPPQLAIEAFDILENRGWGVEIEMISRMSRHEVADVLERHSIRSTAAERSDHNYNRGIWKVTTDGSLNDGGMEVVSPILKGKAGLKELEKVCKILKLNCRAKIDTSCGLHIHHQVETPGVHDLKILRNAIIIYTHYQLDFDKMLPKSRRFLFTCSPYTREELRKIHHANTENDLTHYLARHKTVNVRAYVRHGTCEFRQHSGSVEPEKIINWVIITQAIMKRAIQLAKQEDAFVDQDGNLSGHRFRTAMQEELGLKNEIRLYIDKRVKELNKAA